jgi:hypothetical protein
MGAEGVEEEACARYDDMLYDDMLLSLFEVIERKMDRIRWTIRVGAYLYDSCVSLALR